MTVNITSEVRKLAHEILMASCQPYTDYQLEQIPLIIATKCRYFFANDLNDWEVLLSTLTEEAPEGFRSSWNGFAGATTVEAQLATTKHSVGQGDMVPMHFAHNQVVRFFDDTHAQLLTRMQDYHTYTDNGEHFIGYGIYVDDMLKCSDGVWRISYLRLDKCLQFGCERGGDLSYLTANNG